MVEYDKQITIFSTGVHLQMAKCVLDGREQWRWIAVSFEDDSFYDGEIINPIEYSNDPKKMILSFNRD